MGYYSFMKMSEIMPFVKWMDFEVNRFRSDISHRKAHSI